MGAVLGAVSAAVVVPRMVKLINEKKGTDKSIPQMVLAGASLDDIYVVTLFLTFLKMSLGKGAMLSGFMDIPISVVLVVLVGAIFGYLLNIFFETFYSREMLVRNSLIVVIIMGLALLMIVIALLIRSLGVLFSLFATSLNTKEKIFLLPRKAFTKYLCFINTLILQVFSHVINHWVRTGNEEK